VEQAMSEAIISVSIKAQVGELIAGMKAASAGVDDATKEMADGLRGNATAARATEQAHVGLLGTLKEFKTEQMQQGKLARFYSSELASIVPGAGAAKSAVQGLASAAIEGAAGGGALAIGFEVAKVGIELATAAMAEDKIQAAELREQHFKTWTGIQEAVKKATDSFAGVKTQTQQVEEGLRDGINKQIEELRFKLSEVQRNKNWFQTLFDSGEVEQYRLKIAKLRSEISAPKTETKMKGLLGAETVAEAQKASAETIRLTVSMAGEATRIHAETNLKTKALDDQMRAIRHQDETADISQLEGLRFTIVAESDERIRRLKVADQLAFQQQSLALTRATMSDESAILIDLDTKLLTLKEKARQTDDKAVRAHLAILATLEKEEADRKIRLAQATHDKWVATVLKADEDATRASTEKRVAYFNEADTKVVAKMKEAMHVGQQLGDTLGKSFIAAATGAESFGQAVADVMQQALSAVVNMAIKSLEAYALSAEGAAFFSQAGVPIIGPALGAAAIATTGALFAGLIGAMPHFADGGRYSGGPMLVGENGPEVISPSGSGTVIPNHKLGGLGGITVNISAVDGPSVQRLVESPSFARALKEAQRNGRI
jgi:hypothetical protein